MTNFSENFKIITNSGHPSGKVRALQDIDVPEVPLPLEVTDLAVLSLKRAPLVVAVDRAEELEGAALVHGEVLRLGGFDVERGGKSGDSDQNNQDTCEVHFEAF